MFEDYEQTFFSTVWVNFKKALWSQEGNSAKGWKQKRKEKKVKRDRRRRRTQKLTYIEDEEDLEDGFCLWTNYFVSTFALDLRHTHFASTFSLREKK